MKSYSAFASELTTSQKEQAEDSLKSIRAKYDGHTPLLCASERSSDAAHFKAIELPADWDQSGEDDDGQ